MVGLAESVILPVIGPSRLLQSLTSCMGSLLGYVIGTFSLGPSLKYLRIGGAMNMDSGPPAAMTKE